MMFLSTPLRLINIFTAIVVSPGADSIDIVGQAPGSADEFLWILAASTRF
jgi:hypothetical protein